MYKFLISILLLFGLLSPSLSTSAICVQDPEETDILIIEGGSSGGGPAHYAPAMIPIMAAYYPSLSTILVLFRYDLGLVSVEIENLSTGEYSQTLVNASQGVHPFLISGTSGTWTITFTLSSGVQYYGEFDI